MPGRATPFERKWTVQQQTAIAWAVLDRWPRLTAKQAAQAGANGELPDGDGGRIAPFGNRREDGTLEPMPTNTAQDIVRRERNSRTVRARGRLAKADDGEHATRIVLADAWDGLDTERTRLRRAKNPASKDAIKAWAELAKAANELRKIEAQLAPSKKPKATERTTEKTPEGGEAQRLAREAKRRAKTEHHDAPTHTDSARDRPDTDHKAPETTNEHATDSTARDRSFGSTVSNPNHLDRAVMGSMMQGQDASPLDQPAGSS